MFGRHVPNKRYLISVYIISRGELKEQILTWFAGRWTQMHKEQNQLQTREYIDHKLTRNTQVYTQRINQKDKTHLEEAGAGKRRRQRGCDRQQHKGRANKTNTRPRGTQEVQTIWKSKEQKHK